MDLDFDLGINFDDEEEDVQEGIQVSHRMGHRQLSRRLTSEKALEDAMDWHFKEGDCYHCFSWGDVDFLTYIKMVVRQEPIRYLALSTWCMAGEDVLVLRDWWKRGALGRVDFFVGEIFKGSYPEAYAAAESFCREMGGADRGIQEPRESGDPDRRAVRLPDRIKCKRKYQPTKREHGRDRRQDTRGRLPRDLQRNLSVQPRLR